MPKEKIITIPELVLLATTRVALGAGLGLLLSDRFSRDSRKGAGWALLALGALSTIPLFIEIVGKRPQSTTSFPMAA